MNEQIEDGISIAELFAIVWKRKIVIAIVTFVAMLITTLAVMLVVNPSKTTYQTTFELEFSGIEENKYPSGAIFDYRNIISDERVIEVIDGNNSFSKIDVEEFTNNTIKIEQSLFEEEQNFREYTLTVQANLFDSNEEAIEFVGALISIQYDRIIADFNSLSYSTSLDASLEAETFELELSLLNTQRSYLSSQYSNLITTYGDQEIDGIKLSSYQLSFNSFFVINSITNVTTKLTNSSFVKNESNLASLLLRKNTLDIEIKLLENKIDELILQRDELLNLNLGGEFPEISSYNTQIVDLTIEKVEAEFEVANLQSKIDACGKTLTTQEQKEYDDFVGEINLISDALVSYTIEVSNLSQVLFSQFTLANVANRDVITTQGSVSIILAALVGAVMGGGISCVAFIAFDLNKKEE